MSDFCKYCFLCAMMMGFTIISQGQQTTIYGTVLDSSTHKPLADVKVFLSPGTHTFTTTKNGAYQITNVKAGEYILLAAGVGFKSYSQKIKVNTTPLEITILLSNTVIELQQITIKAEDESSFGIDRLKAVEGTSIYAGKKTEVIKIDNISANLATNSSRQIYSKVPGLNIWESDGAGLQLGIGGRGLSPNRTSNFNTRQNGYDISADALGYPDNYYVPPAEAIDRIEIVRGAASLQYGTQFGGMVNFKLKKGIEDKKFQLILRQTGGSYGFYNSFTSIGGTIKKWNYVAFHQYKQGDGWRENSTFNSNTAHAAFSYQISTRLKVTIEYTFMDYLAQQAGGLTDQLFEKNPQQSIRERNWFHVNWNLAALSLDYKINDQTIINSRCFGLLARRDALGYLESINRADPLEERDFLQDNYKNVGNESRFIHRYTLLTKNAVFLIGARYYRGFTDRKQGNGNNSYGSDFYYVNPEDFEHSDYDFLNQNIALFTENIFYPCDKISITPGIRYEYINTSSDGYYKEQQEDLAGNIIYEETIDDKRSSTRSFALAGIGMSFKKSAGFEWYGNISQNYRAINFNDMRIANPSLRVDLNLKDESGYSTDIGIRGDVNQLLSYDISLFLLSYNNRIGSVLQVDSVLFTTYRYRTNISDSRNYGVEAFAEFDIWKAIRKEKAKCNLSVFVNTALIDARYINSDEAAFENKKVELVPSFMLKTGITYKQKNFKTSLQYAYTGEQYTDATNATYTANAVNGLIPAYYVMDLSMEYSYKRFLLAASVNNLTNHMYFTRRADGYPGPGIIPSDGRSFYVTLQVKI